MAAAMGAGSANRHVTDPDRPFLALGETIVRTHLDLLLSNITQKTPDLYITDIVRYAFLLLNLESISLFP